MNSDPRLSDYLDHVCAPLVGVVPYARRGELRAELRDHLEALVDGLMELGSSPDEAIVSALRQFGNPGRLSRQWAREWHRCTTPRALQPAWKALPAALASFAVATLIAYVLYLSQRQGFAPGVLGAVTGALSPAAQAFCILSVLYLLPLLAGLATGLFAPARHALGAFFALTATIPCLALVYFTNDDLSGLAPTVETCVELAFTQVFLWVPLGCGSAALGGWLQNRLARRPRPWVLQ